MQIYGAEECFFGIRHGLSLFFRTYAFFYDNLLQAGFETPPAKGAASVLFMLQGFDWLQVCGLPRGIECCQPADRE